MVYFIVVQAVGTVTGLIYYSADAEDLAVIIPVLDGHIYHTGYYMISSFLFLVYISSAKALSLPFIL